MFVCSVFFFCFFRNAGLLYLLNFRPGQFGVVGDGYQYIVRDVAHSALAL